MPVIPKKIRIMNCLNKAIKPMGAREIGIHTNLTPWQVRGLIPQLRSVTHTHEQPYEYYVT